MRDGEGALCKVVKIHDFKKTYCTCNRVKRQRELGRVEWISVQSYWNMGKVEKERVNVYVLKRRERGGWGKAM